MTRSALAHFGSYAVIIAGLLVPAASFAAGSSSSPYDQPGTNPAQSNCASPTGCANYATGNQTRAHPGRVSRAQENRITAELNQQQLAGGNNQQAPAPAPEAR